jgi:hypothetical protein
MAAPALKQHAQANAPRISARRSIGISGLPNLFSCPGRLNGFNSTYCCCRGFAIEQERVKSTLSDERLPFA